MQLEDTYVIDDQVLYVYPVKQIHVEGHPEITQFIEISRGTGGHLWLNIKHPMGNTTIKVSASVLRNGLKELTT